MRVKGPDNGERIPTPSLAAALRHAARLMDRSDAQAGGATGAGWTIQSIRNVTEPAAYGVDEWSDWKTEWRKRRDHDGREPASTWLYACRGVADAMTHAMCTSDAGRTGSVTSSDLRNLANQADRGDV